MNDVSALVGTRYRVVLYEPDRLLGTRYPLGVLVERPGQLDFVAWAHGAVVTASELGLSNNQTFMYRDVQKILAATKEARDFYEVPSLFNSLVVYGFIVHFQDEWSIDPISWVSKHVLRNNEMEMK